MLLGVGVMLGITGGLLGIGGGIIAIPLLTYIFGFSQHQAQGTALLLIVPNVLFGCYIYHQRQPLRIKSVILMAICAGVFSFLSARLTIFIPDRYLQILFSLFLAAMGLQYLFPLQSSTLSKGKYLFFNERHLPLVGIISGLMSGLFSVGGGLIVTPILVTFFGYNQTYAQGYALAMVVPGAIAALVSSILADNVSWNTGIPVAIGCMVSISIGVSIAYKISPNKMRMIFSMALFLAAGLTIFCR